jgi:hypothetical protein
MPKLTKEERAELEAKLAADDQDEEDDFEIEIRDGDKAARLPYSRGRAYVQKHFGIDLDPEPETDEADEPKAKPDAKVVPAHFGRSRRSS